MAHSIRSLLGIAVGLTASATYGQSLLFAVIPEQDTAELGDTVSWTLIAELIDPDPTKEILATVSNISFDMVVADSLLAPGFEILNNSFTPAFNSDVFGPADNGIVSGAEILGATGSNTLPPLNNADGPDSSNPLAIYTFDTLITNGTQRTMSGYVTAIHGQFDGAYVGSPFPEIIQYQDANGNQFIPFDNPPLGLLPTLTIVPAPSSLAAFGLSLAIARRRRTR